MKIALLFSSKAGMASSLTRRPDDSTGRGRRAPTRLSRRVRFRRNHQRPWPPRSPRATRSSPSNPTRDAYDRLRELRPDLVFNIAERLFGPNREVAHPHDLRNPRPALHRLRSADARPLPRQIAGQGDPLLPRDPQSRVLDRRARRGPSRGRPAAGHRQAALRRLEQGHQGQLASSTPGPSSRPACDEVTRALQAAGHRRAVSRRPRVHGRRPGQRTRLSRSCRSSRSTTASSRPGARPIYSYEAKWIWDTPDKPLEIFKCPARSRPRSGRRSRSSSPRPAAILRIKDWCRIDVRLDENGEPNILEVNPLPGHPAQARGQLLPAQGGPDRGLFLRRPDPPRRRRSRGPLRARPGGVPRMSADEGERTSSSASPTTPTIPITARKVERRLGGVGRADGQGGPDRRHRARLHVLHPPPAQELHELPQPAQGPQRRRHHQPLRGLRRPSPARGQRGRGLRAPGRGLHRQRLPDAGPLPEQVQDQGRPQVVAACRRRRPSSSTRRTRSSTSPSRSSSSRTPRTPAWASSPESVVPTPRACASRSSGSSTSTSSPPWSRPSSRAASSTCAVFDDDKPEALPGLGDRFLQDARRPAATSAATRPSG